MKTIGGSIINIHKSYSEIEVIFTNLAIVWGAHIVRSSNTPNTAADSGPYPVQAVSPKLGATLKIGFATKSRMIFESNQVTNAAKYNIEGPGPLDLFQRNCPFISRPSIPVSDSEGPQQKHPITDVSK